MSECDKSGCRKIKYVCEDCGRTMQKVDISKPLNDLTSQLSEVRGQLKDEKIKTEIQHNFYMVAIEQRDESYAKLKTVESRAERLSAVNDRYEKALKLIVKADSCIECNESSRPIPLRHLCNPEIARTALAPVEDGIDVKTEETKGPRIMDELGER